MSNEQLSVRGGAQIGWISASWPFARLTVTRDKLEINVLGPYTFTPGEVVAIEKETGFPFIGGGIRIIHNKPEYLKKVVFFPFGSPDTLIWKIQETGFTPSGEREGSVASAPEQRGFPFRSGPVIAVFVLWNALFIVDVLRPFRANPPGPFAILALLMLFVAAVGTLYTEPMQRLILKPGRSVSEIKSFLYLIMLVSGFMIVAFAGLLLTGLTGQTT